MRLVYILPLCFALGCSQSDHPHARTNVQKQDSTSAVLGNSVHVDGPSGDQHPLVCGVGGDFPAGSELAFRHAKSRELVHAVFPEGVTPPKDLNGHFVLHGHYQGIQNWDRYTLKRPKRDYQYFVVSSWEYAEMSPPEVRAQNIRGTPVQITLLTISSKRKFAEISDHFDGTELADKQGFMYSGTDTAGIPVTEEPRTLFWVSSQERDSPVTFFPDRAVLANGAAVTHSTILAETVHMSCPGWEFPLWLRGKDGLSGLLVFPATEGPNLELRLPYSCGQDTDILSCRFRLN